MESAPKAETPHRTHDGFSGEGLPNRTSYCSRKPVVDPIGSVIEEVPRYIGIRRGGQGTVSAGHDAGRRAFYDDEVLVRAFRV